MHNMHSCTHAFDKKKKETSKFVFHIICAIKISLISYVYIETLYEAVVINFRYINDLLWWNGHWSPYVYIETLCEAMVIDFRYIKALFDEMVIDFVCLYEGPLWWNGYWFS